MELTGRDYPAGGTPPSAAPATRNRFGGGGPAWDMPFPRATVDVRSPPADLDALVEWFERVSYNLVLLEEYPLSDVRSGIDQLGGAVRLHASSFRERLRSLPRSENPGPPSGAQLLEDHERFAESIEQLDWLYGILRTEDHGGHRQALGQYGLVFVEAMRRHRASERVYLAGSRARSEIETS